MSDPVEATSGMDRAIVALVEERDHVTFAEIENAVPGFGGGEVALLVRENVLLWAGLTEAGAAAVARILREKRVAITETRGPSHRHRRDHPWLGSSPLAKVEAA